MDIYYLAFAGIMAVTGGFISAIIMDGIVRIVSMRKDSEW